MIDEVYTSSNIDCTNYNELAHLIVESFPRHHDETDPFRVLITTVLSQRSRDENTEIASRNLFSKYNSADELSRAKPQDLYELIKPAGLYNRKAEKIVQIAQIIQTQHDGMVPNSVDELTKLPGVGRKTANIVLYVSFGIPALAVDTHVHRISNRLGWVTTKMPEQTEEALKKLLDPNLWGPINGSMVEFGKNICKPIAPKCDKCILNSCCKYYSRISKKKDC
ncbi:MAG TPA: endonuclease III [Fervidobacterium sp.]|mgnify:FL=1|nr:endonuclease III [Fervidobacterium sp.]HPC24002.1 endonuclease III [Fervidobacterium sp.]HQO05645.1 endonuclease III [Fervidobacterium sp.]HQQ16882.1 endonuclease III [Fervidobacterium sp.]